MVARRERETHLVFWQRVASPHQAPVLKALAEVPGIAVSWVVDSTLENWRAAMGWELPDLGKATLIERPEGRLISDLIDTDTENKVHIFSPSRGTPTARAGMVRLLRNGGNLALMSESADLRPPAGILRLIRGKWHGLRLRGKVDFVLATGKNGMRWYRMCGYAREKIFHYAYFVDVDPESDSKNGLKAFDQNEAVNLLFIGQLVKRKGVDLLIKALAGIGRHDFQLNIVGDGKQRGDLDRLAGKAGLGQRIRFLGSLSNRQTMQVLALTDLLVLPSRWDGWGAVVNEALMRGVPVICSDRCGARDLLDGNRRGAVFRSGSVESLRKTLADWLVRGKPTSEDRKSLVEWSRCITGHSAAVYVLKVIESVYHGGSRPLPPWLGK